MRSKILGYTTSLLVMASLLCNGQQDNTILNTEERGKELGYIYAFSEATRMFIFGDYVRAASLYKECLKYKPESSAVNYQLAEIYLKAGDVKTAHQYSHKAWQLDKMNTWYTVQLANIFQAEQMFDSAVYMYRDLLKGSDADIKVYFQISSLLEKKGDYKESLEYLDRIEKKAGISRETAVSKSRLNNRLGMNKEALIQLRHALNGKEEDYIIIGMIAEFFRTHGRPDSADIYYKKIVPEHLEDVNVMFSYGEFLLEQKRIKEAKLLYGSLFGNARIEESAKYGYVYNAVQDEKFFRRIGPVIDTVINVLIRNSPDDFRVMSLYSDVNYRLGRYTESSRILKKIIEKDPNNFTAWEQLIFCENAMEKSDSVIYYGELAISKFEKRPLPYLLVSSVYYEKKEFKKAIRLLENGIYFADSDQLKIEFYSLLAECYSKTENSGKSDQYYESALLIDSLNVPILNNYAYSLATRGFKMKRAEEMSRYTINKEPENATYLDTYGWVLFQEKDYKGALKYIKKAVENGGHTNAEVLGHYGDILLKLGKSKKAITVYVEALKFADIELKAELNSKIKNLADSGI